MGRGEKEKERGSVGDRRSVGWSGELDPWRHRPIAADQYSVLIKISSCLCAMLTWVSVEIEKRRWE